MQNEQTHPEEQQPPAPNGDPLPRHYKTPFIILALCCAGPLALPLVWKRPNTSRTWKTVVTICVLLLTLALCWVLYLAIVFFIHAMREMMQMMEEM